MSNKHQHPDAYRDALNAWLALTAKWYADNKVEVAAKWSKMTEGQRAAFIQTGPNGDSWVSNSGVLQGSPPTVGSAAVPTKNDPWIAGNASYTQDDFIEVHKLMDKIEAAKPARPRR
jgi:hypothetical protein